MTEQEKLDAILVDMTELLESHHLALQILTKAGKTHNDTLKDLVKRVAFLEQMLVQK